MEEKIITFIISELNDNQPDLSIAADEDLLVSGLVESMGMMRLFQYIENEFSIRVEPQDMTIDNFVTIEAMTRFIKEKKGD